jgi:hypothetical protein
MSDFCPQCGQVKHVGYDLCIDCLEAEWYDSKLYDIEKSYKRKEKMRYWELYVFAACAILGFIWIIGINV